MPGRFGQNAQLADQREPPVSRPGIPFREAVRTWARVAALPFGGPAGQIAVMHRIVVDEKRWIGEGRFLSALNFCMLLPGPEAQQLAIYLGWLLHRTKGGIVAGVLFMLPGFLAILALSLIYLHFGAVPAIEGAFLGLKAAVLAVVVQAVWRIGSRALRSRAALALAALAFVAIHVFAVPFPVIVLGAGITGWAAALSGRAFFAPAGHGSGMDGPKDTEAWLGAEIPPHARRGNTTVRPTLACLALWLVPVSGLLAMLGLDHTFARLGLFFSQMAVVTFGGAYAVLAYVAQAAVETHNWLTPTEMLDGLGMAETTPGPLIQVVQFVGFLGAFRNPGGLDPWVAAVLASLLVTGVTFVPSFLWIFLGALHIERLCGNVALSKTLSAITAAIVGVILNLAVWFGVHGLFARQIALTGGQLDVDLPVPASVEPVAALIAVAAAIALFRFRLGVLPVLIAAALAGALWSLAA
ncbi:MAG: chromate transporter [Limimaricola cinnabarinus]|jgi:chromate transporter|uniref:chromate efflux transporter n=1 Tax=Limimaricola cinnabarinus TaxID=1125964 RepID=UPI0039E473B7